MPDATRPADAVDLPDAVDLRETVDAVSTVAAVDLVGARVSHALDQVGRHAALAGGETRVLLEGARRAVAGGKQLRAQLCLAAAEACGAAPSTADSPAVAAGAALELFQAAALVHDDLMDASDTRRGAPSAHRWFAEQDRGRRGGADETADGSEAFGSGAAILLGDLLLTTSAVTLHRAVAALPAAVRREVNDIYEALAAEVAFGQYLDLVAARSPWDGDAGLDRAWRVVTAKSARYSVELPLALGARIADASDAVVRWFTSLGRDVGIAFQLRDDVLGVFGDPSVTGKPSGDDLREGKRTVLVALAHTAGDGEQRDLLRRHLGRADLPAETARELQHVLEVTGALATVEQHIADHAAAAAAALAAPPAGVGDTARLGRLLRAAVERAA